MIKQLDKMDKYAEDIGGVFSEGDFEAIPYNHWKQDCEWIVIVLAPEDFVAFVPVSALNPREACSIAIQTYLGTYDDKKEENNDE